MHHLTLDRPFWPAGATSRHSLPGDTHRLGSQEGSRLGECIHRVSPGRFPDTAQAVIDAAGDVRDWLDSLRGLRDDPRAVALNAAIERHYGWGGGA